MKLQLPAHTTATATPDPSHICNLHHSSWQRQILNPLSEAWDRTRNLVPSRICFRCATTGPSQVLFYYVFEGEYSFLLTLVVEKTILSPLHCLYDFVFFFLKNHLSMYVSVYFWTVFCFIDLFVYVDVTIYSFDYYSFIWRLEIRYCQSSSFILLFQNCSAILSPLHFHMNFGISLSVSTKKKSVGIALNL